ncbi:MAG TPA: DUF72 domain-containing protein [Pseudoxanthomonas sp.]|nr:DUF72 domain-containing protein [Pseudoxanthomonas sp.]
MPAATVFRIGCASWSYASAHAHCFGTGDSVLARYATRFNAVEINSSFYRSHRPATYRRWADTVPDDFRFSLKLPKLITHEHRLQQCEAALDQFVDECSGLGGKLAGVLVQLPPSLRFDARVAAKFLQMLRRRVTSGLAWEARHASWFGAEARDLLARHDVAQVVADPAACETHGDLAGSSAWRYWRWHGSPKIYYSEYDEAALQALAHEVASIEPSGAMRWAIFDNTALGHAVPNAVRLQTLLAAARQPTGTTHA